MKSLPELTLVLTLLAALVTPALASDDATPAPDTPRPVVSEIVDAHASYRSRFVGIVGARTETDLGFLLAGTLAERPVETGDLVQKGAVLARLDPEDLDADVRAAEAGVQVAMAQLRAARDAENRARELLSRGTDSATRLEDAERALTGAIATVEQSRAALAQARDMRSFATLTAPQDGVIIETDVEAGASVSAGQRVVVLASTDMREITLDVTERDAAALNVGLLFDVTLAANTDVTAQAALRRIDPVAATSTRTRRVHLTLQDPPDGFRLGALVRVSPATTAALDITLDHSAVLDPEGSPAVWMVSRSADGATGTVHRTPVGLGRRFGPRVRITSGISAGDEVVTKGIHSLEEGQTVGPGVSQ
ncbi:efflux RND transporter periplasmic adaptor subunit [Pseudosulfitobacter sp. DSM 107133]|jgi:RND family efflux transporter MFP subunit|uniref:efflux RND transporter periplasmic adaptor subunit n=1 Tax=Pseudosulfitobacter sp. DSM 107133 TaxID=2883100 RepID=UPI000DF1D738|nr:efflux RND transporter periplasmic adaptor subunit [Pseudosulfitobacter sp. DSM 107133]UOA25776.1 Efflux pump periplasmic linker BepF [Pseudosulfitobacter sp. DSM 107133]